MANYYGSARSNYFKVKDETAFQAWAKLRGLEVWEQNTEGEKRFGICPDDNSDSGGWPHFVSDEDGGSKVVCIEKELAQHLQNKSVAVLMETGAEKLRYLVGYAIAINNKGETVEISLDDIYQAAERLGDEVTSAED